MVLGGVTRLNLDPCPAVLRISPASDFLVIAFVSVHFFVNGKLLEEAHSLELR